MIDSPRKKSITINNNYESITKKSITLMTSFIYSLNPLPQIIIKNSNMKYIKQQKSIINKASYFDYCIPSLSLTIIIAFNSMIMLLRYRKYSDVAITLDICYIFSNYSTILDLAVSSSSKYNFT